MSQTGILLEAGTNELEIVEFYIDEPNGYRGYYGINVSKVIEISRSQTVTAMPRMRHPAIQGAFPYRDGRIVPLIDTSRFLDKGGVRNSDSRVISPAISEPGPAAPFCRHFCRMAIQPRTANRRIYPFVWSSSLASC